MNLHEIWRESQGVGGAVDRISKEADAQLNAIRERYDKLVGAMEASTMEMGRHRRDIDKHNEQIAAICGRLVGLRDDLSLLTGHHDRLGVQTGMALGKVHDRLDALEAKQQPAPDTIAVPVAKLRAWQTMVRDIAWEIELSDKADLRWIYNVGQAYADANVVAGEITDVLREVGDEP